MRYFIELSYNGLAYNGWQKQPNAISVQEVLEQALCTLLRTPIVIVGAGRTDAGVHAHQMFAHFDAHMEFKEDDLTYRLNAFLPKDVAVHRIKPVKSNAHARFDALSRTYVYRISTRKNVFNTAAAYHFYHPLDMHKMDKASKILKEYSDFECFSKTNTDVKTFLCKITLAEWLQIGDELHFTITADRFLRNMVRAIVGTMINIGTGKIDVWDLRQIIQSKNRSAAGFSVPAHGLYLQEIVYPTSIFL